MNSNQTYKINNKKSRSQGFTLLEMIVVLILISILLAWGMPNYQSFKARRLVTDYSNEMTYSFTQARAEAVRYGTNVEVRPVGGSWQNGWETVAIGVDGSANTTIAIQEATNNRLALSSLGSETGVMVFNSIGGLVSTGVRDFQLIHDSDSTIGRNISVSMSGSAKVKAL